MRASLRWRTALLAGGLIAAPGVALAQSAPDPQQTTVPQQSDTIGPRELQNFSLPGSPTRPADQQTTAPATQAPTATTSAPSDTAQTAAAPERRVAQERQPLRQTVSIVPPPASKIASSVQTTAPTPAPTEITPGPVGAPVQQPAFSTTTTTPAAPADTLAPEPQHKLSILPWLLAALALGAGTLFLLWRRRPREAFAGGAEFDMFVPPEPAPARPELAPVPLSPPAVQPRAAAPQPAPAQPKPAAPASSGIVSTRLRPQIEISVQPVRCAIDDERVVLEFELELFNAGAAPARSVMAETSLFNAGANQEQDVAAFFASPVGAGERLDVLPPMKRVTFTSEVVAPRSAIQEYELAGRKAIVPVLAFNALYQWSGGQAQTSAAYLVGRETNSDKLGPLGLNGRAREFQALGVRVLPTALRT